MSTREGWRGKRCTGFPALDLDSNGGPPLQVTLFLSPRLQSMRKPHEDVEEVLLAKQDANGGGLAALVDGVGHVGMREGMGGELRRGKRGAREEDNAVRHVAAR